MHTASKAAALAWAPPEALAFYRDERARRDFLAQPAAQMATQDQALQANQAAMEAAQQAAQMTAAPP